ncbi:MAG TPA: RHS repeat-associated core domain-containing protein [Candidatus Dormibacteraeota bacterium]|nr:RHS repeat-associated core domain-containing protein [Candidatus Dormibacteraeota bacterium]
MKNRAPNHPLVLVVISVLVLMVAPKTTCAQDGIEVSNSYNVGLPLNGIFDGTDFDNIQTNSGNLHVTVPLWRASGRGPAMFINYVYDPPTYYLTERCTQNNCYGTWHIGTGGTWRLSTGISYGVVYRQVNAATCNTHSGITIATGVMVVEPDGTRHHFVPDQYGNCFSPILNGIVYADDGSGWMLKVDPNSGIPIYNGYQYDLIRPDGTEIKAVYNATSGGNDLTLTDTNGNQLVYSSVSNKVTDTLGRSITLPSCTPPSCEIDYTDSNGAAQKIQIAISNISISTNFSCPDDLTCTQYNQNAASPTLITLPNGLKYTFTYSTAANPYGELLSATLPTGGTVSWTYQFYIDNSHLQVLTRTVTANGQTFPWSYAYANSGVSTTTVTDPLLNDTRYSCVLMNSTTPGFSTSACEPTKVESFSGSAASGTLLKTVTTDYVNTNAILPIRNTTTWAQTNQVTKVETDWDSFNTGQVTISWRNPINKREYAFGTGTPGSIIRTTSNNYLHLTNSSYLNLNIADKPISTIVYEANGTTVHAKTLYSYDSTTLGSTTGVVSHDYTHFSSSNALRGNSTQIQRWRNTDGAMLTTNNYYNDVGNMIQTMDPATHNTYFDYTDSWYQSTCAPVSGTTQAFVTKKTNALSQFSTAKYNSCTSLVGSNTDLNNQTTTYTYDLMGRRTQTNLPDGGQVAITYGTTLPITNVTTTKITASQNHVTTSVLDDLGHVKQSQVNSDPSGVVYADTTYDGLGRVATASNPYRSTSDPTYGTTTNQYDALGRTIKVTKPDGSFVTTAYCGSTTLVTDETAHWRRSATDALGRLVEVDEPNSLTATVNSNGCPGTGEPIWVTSYSYDVVANLLGVTQNGSRQRSFIYDSLSSLTSSTNPEAGTVLYTYDSEEKVQTKKDARNLTITYAYESLHRMTGRTYSNGDPSAGYTYDQAGCLGQPTCYNIGRRTSMTDAGGSESVSYDKMGRELTHQRVTSSITKNTSYTYNLDGSLATLVYPSGRTVTHAYDNAARPVSAIDTANSINYATAGTYAPQSALAGLTMGSSGTFTGINLSNTYNKRLEPNEVKAWSTAGTAFDLSYCFTPWNTSNNTCPATGNNNGNVTGIINNLDNNRTQFFSYDQVNRIGTAQTVSTFSTNSAKCWGESFVYDTPGGGAWGDLIQINAVTPAYNGCTQESLNVGVNSNNQITGTGFSYDASGNFLTDSHNTYSWNAESEIKSAAGVNYTYDGDGNRVQKSNGKIYWYGAGTEILDESDASGNITDEYIFFGGKRVAHRTVSGNSISYYAEDFLGTTRVMTNSTGIVGYDADFYPFGGERNPYTNTISQHYKFEGKERDIETNNDDFGARYYSSAFGRWLSPDWSAVPAPVPYANLSNPQTLNLYAMVSDNPETFADLDGHDCCDIWDAINFVMGLANAYGSDNLGGAGRQQQDTTAGKVGAAVGDAVATVEGGEKAVTGTAGAIVGTGADATGEGAIVGVPLQVASTALAGQGILEGSTGGVNLIKDIVSSPMESRRVGDLTPNEKKAIDQKNADENGGQNKCTECGRDVQKVQNQKGQTPPENQLQRHHDPPLSKGGNSKSPKNRIVCRACHRKIHTPNEPKKPKP